MSIKHNYIHTETPKNEKYTHKKKETNSGEARHTHNKQILLNIQIDKDITIHLIIRKETNKKLKNALKGT